MDFCIKEGCSFKVTNENDEIIGVSYNYYNKRADFFEETSNESKLKIILDFLKYVRTKIQFFDHYHDCDACIDVNMLSVHPRYRGLGIGRKLIEYALNFAKTHKIPLCYVQCTSYYSANICETLNFDKIFEMPFSEYVLNGEQPLLLDEPHTHFRIFCKRCL